MALRRTASAFVATAKHDYVIVGGGSAGCVLARRLAKDAGRRVLLIENGPSDRGDWDWWKIHMPAALTFNLANNKYNWDYHTVPQKGLDGRQLHQPRGRTLGGSSAINAMAYVRGHALDFERWADEIGSGGETWRYRHVLPYFRKSQCHSEGSSTYRGGAGPLEVGRMHTPEVEAINAAFIEAGLQAGYPKTEDMNGFQQEGFGLMDCTVMGSGERASTANTYLRPLRYPLYEADKEAGSRLDIITRRTATRLIFDGPRAIGVETVDGKGHGDLQQHIAEAEVILCAGAVGSPQLLNLSGIGNAADLEELGIEVRHHLPDVGANLQDHLEFYVQYLANPIPTLYPYAATFSSLPSPLNMYAFRRPDLALKSGYQWMLKGLGLGASNHFEVGGFIRSRAGVQHPDLQFHFIPGIVVGQLDFLAADGFQAHCGTMRPTSRGTIKLSSADFRDAPLIDPNFLTTERDIVDQRAGVRLTAEILEQAAFSDEIIKERFSPEPNFDLDDDKAVDAWVRKMSHSGYHLSCTCAMGRVVDHQGKVFGLEGLRVVDASIMPSMTSGNLNAPTIMMAEKIADSICDKQLPPVEDSVGWYEAPNWETSQR